MAHGRGRVFGLDLMRAVAISLVVADHGRLFFGRLWPERILKAFELGDAGVDLFFVLSGYLIGGILIRDMREDGSLAGLLRFWSRRWWRTVPNYLLFLAVNLVLFDSMQGYHRSARPYLLFGQSLWWEPPWGFSESWSLCVEEWFYLTFPAVAFVAAMTMPRRRAYLGAAGMVAMASFAARAWFVAGRGATFGTVQHGTIFRLDSMMFGVAAAMIAARYPLAWRAWRRPATVAGAACLAVAMAMRVGLGESHWLVRTVYFDAMGLGAAFLLPAASAWMTASAPATRWAGGISMLSYSIYLANLPLRTCLLLAFDPPDRWWLACAMAGDWLVLVGIASWCCYHGFESRVTRLRDVDWRGLLPRRRVESPR